MADRDLSRYRIMASYVLTIFVLFICIPRRAVVQALMSRASSCSSARKAATQAAKKSRVVPHLDLLREREEDFCTSITKVTKDEWQKTLVDKHRSWLKKGFTN